jgi:hypothetical protein
MAEIQGSSDGTSGQHSVNRRGVAVQKLSTARRGPPRKLVHGPEHTWLSKRRDGRSPCYMVTWYDPGTRQVRYRTTGTTSLQEAKEVLAAFRLPDGARTHPPAPRRKTAWIYFIGGDTGAIKIGAAIDPLRRLAGLQCGSPIELRILAQGPGSPRDERILHERFAPFRLHGEWFERSPEILAEIDRLNGGTE